MNPQDCMELFDTMKRNDQAEINRLEQQLEKDIKASAAAAAAKHKAEDLDAKAKMKVFETRKALIKAYNRLTD